jgi:adenosine deaminase
VIPTTVLPKVVLHDHLDGGLRPETIIELAEDVGYSGLPSQDRKTLQAALYQGESRSLVAYLEAFRHTVAVMQTSRALERVAREAVEDLAADGVVYAELRFAPSLHMELGLDRSGVLAAVLRGVRSGTEITGVPVGVIVDAMRQEDDSEEVAELAVQYRSEGVVGFDLAGPEAGFPASRHGAACRTAREGGLGLTIHAGEADGPASIGDALDAGARRIGHGVRVVDDLEVAPDGALRFGAVAGRVHDDAIVLEVCPHSNVHTRAVPSLELHPIGLLYRNGFAVTVNTDNRLMSGTSMTAELDAVVAHHGFTGDDLAAITLRAVDAAFCDEQTRAQVRARVADGFAAAV